MYATTTAGYRGPPVGFKPAQTLNPNLQKNHFTIGDQNVPLMNKTTYTNNYRNFGNAVQAQARDQTQDRGSNFNFGAQRAPWVTESQQQYFMNFLQLSNLFLIVILIMKVLNQLILKDF